MSHDDFAFEPIPGLPEHLPEGERILWQGSPRWTGLAKHALHHRKVMGYCLILLAWVAASGFAEGPTIAAVVQKLAGPVAMVAVLFAIIQGLAFWLARSTIYTITDRRVVMRFGIVLPMTINLPFKMIASASLRQHGDGSGDIPLALAGSDRIAWLHLWPHARPWRFKTPEPMLRDIQSVGHVATLLAEAMVKALPEGRASILGDGKTDRPAAGSGQRSRELATA